MGSDRKGGRALLEDDCDSGRKVKVAEKNYVDYSVGGEGRRTTLGWSVPGASAEDVRMRRGYVLR